MKLDASLLRFLDDDHWQVLTAVEQGMKNHELVPVPIIDRIAGLRHGGMKKRLVTLLRYKLVAHENRQYDGYRLTYLGYDFLSLHTLLLRKKVTAVGNQVGVGKEADIFVVSNAEGKEMILKLHRLGRTSFTNVTQKRDYFRQPGKRQGASWLHLSRLAAIKEYAFMQALHSAGFNVPTPIDHTRHCVLMSIVPGYTLANVRQMAHPERVYQRCLDALTRLAQHGLIHGDLNEYNIMVTEEEQVFIIDFPQMTSTEHLNAQMYFDRDLTGIHKFFGKRFNISYEYAPKLKEDPDLKKVTDLDAAVGASGWSNANQQVMDRLVEQQGGWGAEGEDEDAEGSDVEVKEGDEQHEDGEEDEEGEEEEEEEEEEAEKAGGPEGEVTLEVTPERTLLNEKGRGFFNAERWDEAQDVEVGRSIALRGKKQLRRQQLRQKDRLEAAAQAQDIVARAAAQQEERSELRSLGQRDEEYVKLRLKQQIGREMAKEDLARAWRKNQAKGREKVKERSLCKVAALMGD